MLMRTSIKIPANNENDKHSKHIKPIKVRIEPPGINERQKLAIDKHGRKQRKLIIMAIANKPATKADVKFTQPEQTIRQAEIKR